MFTRNDSLRTYVVSQLTQILDDLDQDPSLNNRTGKLWVEYLKMVRVLVIFIRAERTGDCDLHLFCIAKMIPSSIPEDILHVQSLPGFIWTR